MLGGLFALFAAGLSLIFGVMRLVNIAHGDFIVLSAFIALSITSALHINVFLAALLVLPLMGFGYVLQRFVLNKTLGDDILPPLLVTFGLSVILQNSLLEVYSADPQKLQAGALETASFAVGPINIGVLPFAMFLVAVAVIAGLQWIFYKTALGRAFRATSDNADIAQLMGLNKAHIFGLVGLNKAHIFGLVWGTLIGGILLGVAQAVGGSIHPGWQVLSGHLVFLLILAVRPRGLFPRIEH